MIKLEVVKHQMSKMGINAYYLWKLTGVGRTIVYGLMSGERQLPTVQAKNYEQIISSLFTGLERTLAEQSTTPEHYDALYKQALESVLNNSDVKIYRSGALEYNQDVPLSVPVHIQVRWGFAINDDSGMRGMHLYSLRIFDNAMYREMNRNSGQRNKLNLLKESFSCGYN